MVLLVLSVSVAVFCDSAAAKGIKCSKTYTSGSYSYTAHSCYGSWYIYVDFGSEDNARQVYSFYGTELNNNLISFKDCSHLTLKDRDIKQRTADIRKTKLKGDKPFIARYP